MKNRAVFAGICVAYAAALFLLTGGYAIDDTWIHLQFARNLASGLGFRFIPTHPPVYAASSPAWAMVLSLTYAGGIGGIEAARALSSLFAGLSVWMMARILGRAGVQEGVAFAGAAVLAANPWMIRWGASGMESTAAVAAVEAILLALWAPGSRALPAGVLSGLAFLVRPELVVAGPVCAIALAIPSGPGRLRRALGCLGAWAVIVACWEAVAGLTFGSFLPATALAKASRAAFGAYLPGALREMAGALAASDAVLVACLVPSLLLARDGRLRRSPSIFALALAAALPILLLAGRAPMVSRYMLPISPCIAALAIPALESSGRRLGPALAAILAPIAAAVSLTVGILFVAPHMRSTAANLDLYRDIAAYMRDSLPEGSVVAVQEIGIFEYYGGVELLDLGGLVTPGVNDSTFPGMDRDAFASLSFLRERGVTHYLDPHGLLAPMMQAADRIRVGLVPLREWTFSGGTALSGGGTYTRVLYRLEWM